VKELVRSLKGEKWRIAYLRLETEPALQAQVDWGDFQIEEPDGTIKMVYAFIMVLGFSRGLYVEFVEKWTLESFMDFHIHAFDYLVGCPREILYDRMKHVVVGKGNSQPVLNREFLHFSYHYGFLPRLCPPYAPWAKGKSERPIRFLRERFWRGYVYHDLDEANRGVGTLLETANRRVHGTHGQPVDARWAQEKPLLSAMPYSISNAVPYPTATSPLTDTLHSRADRLKTCAKPAKTRTLLVRPFIGNNTHECRGKDKRPESWERFGVCLLLCSHLFLQSRYLSLVPMHRTLKAFVNARQNGSRPSSISVMRSASRSS
jgi:hypothetical protein